MSEPKIVCEGCGKQYAWKESLAGKKVKCKCGHVMRIPDKPPVEDDGLGPLELEFADTPSHLAPPPPPPPKAKPAEPKPPAIDTDDISFMDVPAKAPEPAVPEGGCPSCGAPLADGAVICIQCGFNVKAGKKLGTEKGEVEVEEGAASAMLGKLKGLFKRKSKE
ncbi:MAG: zinc-ribbon domain-containing protein [Planctomycetes bacterium]|nr:zinc-ribbon domain-containing protein [Planctomycetota bacterium]